MGRWRLEESFRFATDEEMEGGGSEGRGGGR